MDVTLDLKKNSYTVYIKNGLLQSVGKKMRDLVAKKSFSNKILIVADSNTGALFLEEAKKSLKGEGFEVYEICLPAGEIYKSISAVELIWEKALSCGLDRNSVLFALGGGVISDLTGFAAATYLRGINFVSLPTTLLAQVDASVGGKTGFNLRSGKNMVGSFYQPRAVFVDTETLLSLPEREYINGFAEVIKHGLICNTDLLEILEESIPQIKSRDTEFLSRVVNKNVLIKADIVSFDEKETSKRATLNLGHTLGHALEELGDYKLFLHGEAVSYGILVASLISLKRGLIEETDFLRIADILKKVGLIKGRLPSIKAEALWEKTFKDKKSRSGIVYWVLPKKDASADGRFDEALFGQEVHFQEVALALDRIEKGI